MALAFDLRRPAVQLRPGAFQAMLVRWIELGITAAAFLFILALVAGVF